jgi:23S rRNA (adenine2030-N6)-methyltransferase
MLDAEGFSKDMNYRHIYHAGNFADVLKHAVLALVIEYMKGKPAPFRVIDTHAGIGLYDLSSEEAQKTGEYRTGIARLLEASLPVGVGALLAPYLDVVCALNTPGKIECYPGSPYLAHKLTRSADTLVACELHPDDWLSLRQLFAADPRIKVLHLDGWLGLKSLLPPKERRGLILIDPPFEEPGEFERMEQGLAAIHRRFATGTAILWYPIKDPAPARDFRLKAMKTGFSKALSIELYVRAPRHEDVLNGTGLLIVNPPFVLADQLASLMPYLTATLGVAEGAFFRLENQSGMLLNSS